MYFMRTYTDYFSLWSILKLRFLELRAVEDPPSETLVASTAAQLESDCVLQLLAEGSLRLHVGGLHSRRGLVQGKRRICKRFMIVDDNSSNLDIVRKNLENDPGRFG